MKNLSSYILERFINKKQEKYIIYYPWDEDLVWANKKYSDEACEANGGVLWLFPESEAENLQHTASWTMIIYIPNKYTKDEFIKAWQNGEIKPIDFNDYKKYKFN